MVERPQDDVRVGRRQAISGLAAGAGVAWVTPSIIGFGDVAAAASPVRCDDTVTTVAVPFEADGWRHQEVAPGTGAGFQDPAFDDSGFSTGAAAFGDYGGGPTGSATICGVPPSTTPWAPNTDLLLRRELTVPAETQGITITVRFDNFAAVWWDGNELLATDNGGPCGGEASVLVPEGLTPPGSHVLAVRGEDLGGERYLDARVRITTCV